MEIKKLIAKGETELAINALMKLASKTNNADLENQVINWSSQFHALEKKRKSFTITSDQASAKLAQINRVLLDIVSDLEETSPPHADPETFADLEVDINELEKLQILERLQLLMKRNKFFQDQFDISSDASQKFNLQENIDDMSQQITLLKEALAKFA